MKKDGTCRNKQFVAEFVRSSHAQEPEGKAHALYQALIGLLAWEMPVESTDGFHRKVDGEETDAARRDLRSIEQG